MISLAVVGDIHWMHDALCAEPHYNQDAWFPPKGQATTAAKTVCQQCGVQDACLAYAISEDIRDGIWGGTTPEERKKLLRSGRVDLVRTVGQNDPTPHNVTNRWM
jgi:WhiB family transcriptional regulator, redox-sensing transcriptional regulator